MLFISFHNMDEYGDIIILYGRIIMANIGYKGIIIIAEGKQNVKHDMWC